LGQRGACYKDGHRQRGKGPRGVLEFGHTDLEPARMRPHMMEQGIAGVGAKFRGRLYMASQIKKKGSFKKRLHLDAEFRAAFQAVLQGGFAAQKFRKALLENGLKACLRGRYFHRPQMTRECLQRIHPKGSDVALVFFHHAGNVFFRHPLDEFQDQDLLLLG
jgi:hypothetical protein